MASVLRDSDGAKFADLRLLQVAENELPVAYRGYVRDKNEYGGFEKERRAFIASLKGAGVGVA